MANLIDAGGSGGAYARGVVAQAAAAILPEVRRLIDESIGRIAVRADGNLTAVGIRSALMFDPAATAVVDDPDHEQVIVPLGGGSALPTICHVYRSTDKNILAGTFTAVDFDGERTDPAGLHSPTVNPSRITFATSGRYRAVATITWHVSGGTEQYRAWLFLNGSILLAQADCNCALVSDVGCTLTYEFDAAAGDYVELYVRHTATTGIFLVGDDVGDGSGDRGTEVSVTKIG